jgi:hypothetical protein
MRSFVRPFGLGISKPRRCKLVMSAVGAFVSPSNNHGSHLHVVTARLSPRARHARIPSANRRSLRLACRQRPVGATRRQSCHPRLGIQAYLRGLGEKGCASGLLAPATHGLRQSKAVQLRRFRRLVADPDVRPPPFRVSDSWKKACSSNPALKSPHWSI